MSKVRLNSKWKGKWPMVVALSIELVGITATLALFGIASPDTFRDKLWLDGGMNGFNSDPRELVYYYANYKTPPPTPLIWSSFLTNYNVAISIVFLFVLLIKAVLFVVHLFRPIVSLVLHMLILGAWSFCLYGQLSPDYSDSAHPAKIPWYFTHSCSAAAKPSNVHYCLIARGTLAATVIMVALYVYYIGVALHSLFVVEKVHAGKEIDNESQASIEMYQPEVNHQKLPSVPITPRTQAFNRLEGASSLPLRNYNPMDYQPK